MTGVLWMVQVLVYPNFKLIPGSLFPEFHAFHSRRITLVVAPAMGLELCTGLGLLWFDQSLIAIANLGSILALWVLTGLVSVPLHNQLETDPSKSKDSLIRTNWARTVIWTLRSIGWILYMALSAQN